MGEHVDSVVKPTEVEKFLNAIYVIDSGFQSESLDWNMQLSSIENWDSLTAISFCIRLEKEFHLSEGSIALTKGDTIGTVIAKVRALQTDDCNR